MLVKQREADGIGLLKYYREKEGCKLFVPGFNI